MRPRHLLLAVGVAFVWGFNFVVIHVGLGQLPPLLFNALRFTLAAFPAVLFVGPPRVRWRWVLLVGLALGVAKFSLLFAGMAAGMPAGLSSLVLQSQAVFTLVLAVILLRERPDRRQIVGMAVAVLGLVVVTLGVGPARPPLAFALVIAAAMAWGVSNVATRRAAPPDSFRFMVWVSAVVPVPVLALSLLTEGVDTDLRALASLDLTGVGALVYVAGVSTLLGFAVWGRLLRTYDAGTVAPFSMLVPFFGMTSAALLLDESIRLTDVLGGIAVVGGVLYGAVRRRGATSAGAASTEKAGSPSPDQALSHSR
ncbi:O-acetylserine/cysteine efflux transporter [Streptoalloteichus tenebrarius]|uniref:O-acetylserine/cysteine efflux transporter n=1 Tax=Streptoalloteichus tenebrarius (strain ATCC 17920 / DSM 40477 / JCM 4838 / CBS 697.72 / NBRC 16177 / NCIMB 11028 / NRRL B-12390 / A12253. 1 / ISP 5477) TaxID=1933 RepID=A0ABT1HU99_STRSD|nr:EamA family transporter [Streptoalloteichus tenebrarius]MCP2259071.1 O-acetylserine/cysteine efflux transporter [Streptoalloteichus tenebrarius]